MGNKLSLLVIFYLLLTVLTRSAFADNPASGSSAKFQTLTKQSDSDYRVRVLRSYLKSYNSPLVHSAKDFVKYADENNIDWRLVAAISGVESTFGHQIPYQSYNGWGWGIYGDNTYSFESWENGIRTISKGLREKYMDKWGASNVYEIGRFYASSPTWATRVDYFMNKIQDYALRNPQDTLSLAL